jgi:hypothetical protein
MPLSGEQVRGWPALERGGTSPEGATGPRARQKFASAVPCPSSEAEFRPRVVGPTVWWAAGATRGPWARSLGCELSYVCFRFVYVLFFAKESGFSLVV